MRRITGTLQGPDGASLPNTKIRIFAVTSSSGAAAVPAGALAAPMTNASGIYDFSLQPGYYEARLMLRHVDTLLGRFVVETSVIAVDLLTLIGVELPADFAIRFAQGRSGLVPGPTEADVLAIRVLAANGGWINAPPSPNYTHLQPVPALVWSINHNLGFQPAIALLDPGSAEFDGEILHISVNQALAIHDVAQAGSARCK